MPKIRVTWDEAYPVYCITTDFDDLELEVTDEELAFILQAEEDYDKAQAILERCREVRPGATQP